MVIILIKKFDNCGHTLEWSNDSQSQIYEKTLKSHIIITLFLYYSIDIFITVTYVKSEQFSFGYITLASVCFIARDLLCEIISWFAVAKIININCGGYLRMGLSSIYHFLFVY